jgi:hypothetical protein
VLEKIKDRSLPKPPSIIVLSALGQEEIIRHASDYGIQ